MTWNYAYGLADAVVHSGTDPWTLVAIGLAGPYNAELINRLLRIKDKDFRLIGTVREVVGQITGIARYRIGHVPIRWNGFPDFRPALYEITDTRKLKVPTVFVRLSGRYFGAGGDFALARLRTMFPGGQFRRGIRDYVWHHHEIPGVMQLVHRRFHAAGFAAHVGGTAYYRIAMNDRFAYRGGL